MFKIISIPAGASPGLAPLVLLISSLLLPCCRTSMTISLLRIFSLRHNSCLSNKKRDILDNRGTDCWNWSSLCLVQNKTPNRQQSLSLISSLKNINKKQADEVVHQYLQQSPSLNNKKSKNKRRHNYTSVWRHTPPILRKLVYPVTFFFLKHDDGRNYEHDWKTAPKIEIVNPRKFEKNCCKNLKPILLQILWVFSK